MSIPAFPTSNKDYVQAALAEVAAGETGTILNDHYSASFYTERRANFLGKHPDYSGMRNGMMELACEHSFVVFGDDDDNDLSVQEVRRREIKNELIPFLPFPTKENTETLENHAGYPYSEWAEGKEGVFPEASPSPPPRGASIGGNASQDAVTPDRQLEDSAQQSPTAEGTEFLPGIGDRINQLFPANLREANQNDAAAATDASDEDDEEIDQQQQPTMSTVAGPSRTASGSSQSSRPATARDSVASYVQRPTEQAIKYKRGTKRPLTGPNEVAESVSSDSEVEASSVSSEDDEPQPKRRKTEQQAPVKPVKKPKQAPTATKAPGGKGKQAAAAPKSSAAKKSATSKSKGPSIAAIVAGRALPRAPAQAKTADDERYELLRAAHNRQRRARKKSQQEHPELMPEYFHVENFPAGGETEQVRCLCEVITDDGYQMLCCDKCDVWQHIACVGQAAPEDLEGGAYRCHNCDPFAHRHWIRDRRAANPVQ